MQVLAEPLLFGGGQAELLTAMGEMKEMAQHPQVKQGLEQHIKETEPHCAGLAAIKVPRYVVFAMVEVTPFAGMGDGLKIGLVAPKKELS